MFETVPFGEEGKGTPGKGVTWNYDPSQSPVRLQCQAHVEAVRLEEQAGGAGPWEVLSESMLKFNPKNKEPPKSFK